MSKRINDPSRVTATIPNNDDYLLIDGDDNGTRNILCSGFALSTDLVSKADDNSVVHLAGTETITGNKSFSGTTTIGNGTGLLKTTSGTVSNATAGTDYSVPSGTETISGQKSFTNISNIFYGDGSNLTNVGTKNITQLCTCSTASATAEKAITLSGVALTDGLTLLVEFTNANTASSITINLNTTGAKALVDKRGNTPNFSNKAGEKVLITYDSANTKWILLNAEFYNSRLGHPSTSYIDLTVGASGSTYTAPADGWAYIQGNLATGGSVKLGNTTVGIESTSVVKIGFSPGRAYMPAKAGETISYFYDLTPDALKFYYCEGSKP